MKIYKTVVVLLLLLTSLHNYAQKIYQGKVVTNNNLSLTAITIIADENTKKGTSTDVDGNFSIRLNNPKITVSAIGYQTKKVILSSNFNTIILVEKSEGLNEVIVTANKREENILKVSTAVTALNAKQIENTKIQTFHDLTSRIPNYNYQELGVGFQQIQSIRGIQVFSENPAVATYIDGVNNLDILANGFALVDIDKIEVLRGPQGTIFGRNAMGGVVNITTKQPTNKTEGFAEIGFGNLETQRYALGFKTPIVTDKLFFGINALYQTREGYFTNTIEGTASTDTSLNGKKVGGEQNIYGNLFLKWLATDNFSATFNLKKQRDWSDNTGFYVAQLSDELAFANPDKINLTRIGEHERNITNASLALKYNTNSSALISITTYQAISLGFKNIDFPGVYHSFYKNEIGENLKPQEVWSQEFRINSLKRDSKINYTAGVYGFTQVGYEPSSNLAFESAPNAFTVFRNKSDNKGLAVFGELDYCFTQKLKGTIGLRYDYEERESTFNGFGDALFDGNTLTFVKPDQVKKGTYNALSPKFALNYAINDKSNVYVTYTRGFRAGGINAQGLPEGTSQTYDPEYSNNYEIGYKMFGKNNKFSLAFAGFYIDWKDIQFFNLVAPFTYARDNFGDAVSKGIEFEGTVIPIKGFQIDATIGINDTEYKDFSLTRVNFGTGEENIIKIGGNSLSNAPKTTFLFGAQYDCKATENFSIFIRLETQSVGNYFTDIQNDLEQPAYNLVNSQIRFNYKNYSLSIWGKNLSNERYLAYGAPDTSFDRKSIMARPRTFGASLIAKF